MKCGAVGIMEEISLADLLVRLYAYLPTTHVLCAFDYIGGVDRGEVILWIPGWTTPHSLEVVRGMVRPYCALLRPHDTFDSWLTYMFRGVAMLEIMWPSILDGEDRSQCGRLRWPMVQVARHEDGFLLAIGDFRLFLMRECFAVLNVLLLYTLAPAGPEL
jgi:hypothetical protein